MILLDKQIACLPTSPMAGVAARQPLFFCLGGRAFSFRGTRFFQEIPNPVDRLQASS